LFLVTLDSVTPIELPAEISSINGVHALSPNAPEFSALVEP
jgi:hypothetical protein